MLTLETSGAPERTSSLGGIEYLTDDVVFTDTKIGKAALYGGLECAKPEGD